ncbi:MAG: zinc-binding alcohol dehydrogenase [Pseudomonadota bacterium]
MASLAHPDRNARNPHCAIARVAWLKGPGELVWRKESLPPPDIGQVLCETLFSAISPGTELAAWRGSPPLKPGNPYPRVQGYCNVARVLEIGKGVDELKPGDRVLTLQSHRSRFVCPADEIYVTLAPEMDARRVATSYLFHLGYNAVLRSGVRAGHRVVVIGLGVLGLTSVAMASRAGAEVIAVSDHSSVQEIARTAYSALKVGSRKEAPHLRQSGADAVILTTNRWEDCRLAMELAGQNAVIACLGFPGREEAPGDYNPLAAEPFYTKQLRIEAVGMSPLENDPLGFNRFNLRDNLGFITRAIAPLADPIISGICPASGLNRAYEDLAARKRNAVTYLLDWSG